MSRRLARAPWVFLVLALTGCSSTTTVSDDPERNYEWAFASTLSPKPEIVNSRLERMHRCCFLKDINGDWEFELRASRHWVDGALTNLEKIEWTKIWPNREVPDWFTPTPEEFSAWRLQRTSYPNAHVFVERHPQDESRIHVFVRRH
jgi:hypothetical protein